MDATTLYKKRAAGLIHAEPDPDITGAYLYSLADAEREAPPTIERVAEFVDSGQRYVWVQHAPKKLDVSIPTLKRWDADGRIKLVTRNFAGTRGIRLFASEVEVRKAKRLVEPVAAGHKLLAEAAAQFKMDAATIRHLVYAGTVGHGW